MAKVTALVFDYGSDNTLQLHLKSLLPWTVFFGLVVSPLFVLAGWQFVAWFNFVSLFMLMFGYAGFLILFSGMSIGQSVKRLWHSFVVELNTMHVFGVIVFANLYLILELNMLSKVPEWLVPPGFLLALILVSSKMKRFL